MSLPLTISRVNELPASPAANAIYIVKSEVAGKAELYFTGNNPSTVMSMITHSEVEGMISDMVEKAVSDAKSVFIYKDFPSMRRESFDHVVLAYVEDATADPINPAPNAAYIFDPTNNTWIPLPAGKKDISWTDIKNGPTSSATSIDLAVAATHSHSNKVTLDKIGESNDGLTFEGKPVQNITVTSNW